MALQRALWREALGADFRYAVRSLRSRPLSTAVVVITLALGIGAAATTYGVMRRLLLQPPPYVAGPTQLSQLYFDEQRADGTVDTSDRASYPFYEVLRENGRAVAEVAAFGDVEEVPINGGAGATRVRTQIVSPGFWHVLGVRPFAGRFFLDREAAPSSGERVVVLSHAFWRRHFGADRSVIGTTLQVRGLTYQIVGVAPTGFRGLGLTAADLWLPLSARTDLDRRRAPWHTLADSRELHLVARTRAGLTPARAAAVFSGLYGGFAEARTQSRSASARQPGVKLGPVAGVLTRDMKRTPEATVSVWLVGVAFILLAISCANVAGLLLIRTLRRRVEIATRLALGMSRGRLFALVFTESCVLALMGAAASGLVLIWGRAWVWRVLFPQLTSEDLPFDWHVLGLAATCTVGTTLLTGLAPVLQAGSHVLAVPRGVSADWPGRRSRAQSLLLVAQTALSVVLLMGAGLFVRSLWRVTTQDLGLEPRQVLTVQVDFVGSGRSRREVTGFYERALETVRALPGVTHATMALSIPLRGALGDRVRLSGASEWLRGSDGYVKSNLVADAFFATTGMTIVQGRDVLESDRTGAPKVVVNETLAEAAWPGRSPVGECVYLESTPNACATVIGVSKNARSFSVVKETELPWLYQVLSTGDSTGALMRALLVRVSPRSSGVEATLRQALLGLEAGVPYVDIRHLDDEIEPEVRPWRVGAAVFSALGAVAMLLAALGIYATVAYGVALRTREMGVRMAIGATATDVVRLVIRDGLRLSGAGIAVGMAVALLGGRWLEPLLFETSARDAGVVAGVVMALFFVALLATLVPARRAARLSPSIALLADT